MSSCDSDCNSDSASSSSSSSSNSSSSSSASSSSSSGSEDDSSSISNNDNNKQSSSSSSSSESDDNDNNQSDSESDSCSASNSDGSSEKDGSSDDDNDDGEDSDDADEDSDDEDDENSLASGYSSRSSNSSSNKFRYSNVMINKNSTTKSQRDQTNADFWKHSDQDNLFTSLSKSPNSLPKISFLSAMTPTIATQGDKSMRGLPNRHATVPAPDTRPIPNKNQSLNANSNNNLHHKGSSDHHQKSSLMLSPNSSNNIKSPKFKARVKREDIIDIPITELDRDILMAIGKIKRQKQRPSVDRLYNICCKLKKPQFDSKMKIQSLLDDMVKRSLLAKVENPGKGFISYRELNSAIPIVAINNPLKSRAHLIELNGNLNHLNQNDRQKNSNNQTNSATKTPSSSSCKSSMNINSSSSPKKTVSTATMTNSIDESIERVVRRFCRTETSTTKISTKESIEKLRCGMCGKSDKNELITCSVCGMSGHSTCLGCSETLLKRIKEFPDWECPNCKKCPVCGLHDDETNIVCVVCDRAFHRHCLGKYASHSVFLSRFTCDDCDKLRKKQSSSSKSNKAKPKNLTKTRQLSSPVDDPIPFHRSKVYDCCSSKDFTNSISNDIADEKLEDFQRKYLGRRGRRKGSFHLKRDLVSYKVLATQKSNLSHLNYTLVQRQIPELNINQKDPHCCDHSSYNGQFHDNAVDHLSDVKLNSITADCEQDQQTLEGKTKMRRPNKQTLITQYITKGRKDPSSNVLVSDSETNSSTRTRSSQTKKSKDKVSKSKLSSPLKSKKTKKNHQTTIVESILKKSSNPCLKPKNKGRSKSSKTKGVSDERLSTGSEKFKSNYRALSPPLSLNATLEITPEDNELFKKVQQIAENRLSSIILTPLKSQSPGSKIVGEHSVQLRCPAAIEIGNYEIETWYSSLYPHEYARLQKLFICEFCLKYMKSSDMLSRHMKKCWVKKPPGDEIYRGKQLIPNFHIKTPIYISVYEVDGANAKWYCQNLCLLGKLFIDHKTLLFDVEHFLFYILTIDDIYGSHFVGYFSKEKFSSKRYNVSCIVTLPQFQRCGFGRFLIDFSYLLSKRENLTGTPEKPLSDLGKLSYLSYWRFRIYQYMDKCFKQSNDRDISLSVDTISIETGLNINDITSTLQWINAFKKVNNDWILEFKEEEIEKCLQKPRIVLKEENLIWTPLISHELQVYEDEEVYNVLFYDDQLNQENASLIKSLQMPGKLKKKRRRRWNKAYNQSAKKRKKSVKPDGTEKSIYDDEDSQMVSAYENEEEDATEDEDISEENYSINNGIEITNGNSKESIRKTPTKTELITSSPNKSSCTLNNIDDSSCDKLSIDGYDETNRKHENSNKPISPFGKLRSSPRQSSRRSRSPLKRFNSKENESHNKKTTLVNGSSKEINQTNGKLQRKDSAMEDDIFHSIDSEESSSEMELCT